MKITHLRVKSRPSKIVAKVRVKALRSRKNTSFRVRLTLFRRRKIATKAKINRWKLFTAKNRLERAVVKRRAAITNTRRAQYKHFFRHYCVRTHGPKGVFVIRHLRAHNRAKLYRIARRRVQRVVRELLQAASRGRRLLLKRRRRFLKRLRRQKYICRSVQRARRRSYALKRAPLVRSTNLQLARGLVVARVERRLYRSLRLRRRRIVRIRRVLVLTSRPRRAALSSRRRFLLQSHRRARKGQASQEKRPTDQKARLVQGRQTNQERRLSRESRSARKRRLARARRADQKKPLAQAGQFARSLVRESRQLLSGWTALRLQRRNRSHCLKFKPTLSNKVLATLFRRKRKQYKSWSRALTARSRLKRGHVTRGLRRYRRRATRRERLRRCLEVLERHDVPGYRLSRYKRRLLLSPVAITKCQKILYNSRRRSVARSANWQRSISKRARQFASVASVQRATIVVPLNGVALRYAVSERRDTALSVIRAGIRTRIRVYRRARKRTRLSQRLDGYARHLSWRQYKAHRNKRRPAAHRPWGRCPVYRFQGIDGLSRSYRRARTIEGKVRRLSIAGWGRHRPYHVRGLWRLFRSKSARWSKFSAAHPPQEFHLPASIKKYILGRGTPRSFKFCLASLNHRFLRTALEGGHAIETFMGHRLRQRYVHETPSAFIRERARRIFAPSMARRFSARPLYAYNFRGKKAATLRPHLLSRVVELHRPCPRRISRLLGRISRQTQVLLEKPLVRNITSAAPVVELYWQKNKSATRQFSSELQQTLNRLPIHSNLATSPVAVNRSKILLSHSAKLRWRWNSRRYITQKKRIRSELARHAKCLWLLSKQEAEASQERYEREVALGSVLQGLVADLEYSITEDLIPAFIEIE